MRLVFFGDSFTFGQGFPDCIARTWEEVDQPSKLNWPAQVAEALQTVYINKSGPGMSNQEIFKTMREFDFEQGDLIIAQWSYLDRDMICHRNSIERIAPWGDEKLWVRYCKVHSDYDTARRAAMTIEHAALWLKHPFLFFSDSLYDKPWDSLVLDYMMRCHRDSLEDGHPGIETNRAWAALVIDKIKERGHWAP